MTSYIHRDSPVCVKSELDLFTIPPTQTAIEKGQFVEYHPLANIRDGGPIEFNISGSGEDYIDLAASYIHVKVKVVKADGSNLTDKEPVAPVILFLHSLFSQVDVSLNERNISSATNTYPYRAFIETLLNYGEDAKKSLLTCEGFFQDTSPNKIDVLAQDADAGLKARGELIKNSQSVDLIGQLHFSTEKDADYKVILDHASLFIRKVKVNPGVSLGHVKALEKSSAKYPIDRVLCKTYSVSKGSWSFMQDNVFLGLMPKRVIITCVENAAMNGQYSMNPFLFAHHHVNFISIYVDGQPVPCKPMDLDFESNHYVRAYHSLFSGFNRDKGIYLSREEFVKGHVLYAFDLTPDMCDGSHFNLQHQGNLRVEIKFAKALSVTLSVLVYAEFQNVIEITKSRHVLCDFAN
ncbi:uncharacterized protein F54H12.2-like [Stegodyphus dumicola]|uniref:uncharacterized protein F54H12.2-like n=1 Tax=Stegodyphus dumicola TaxID=202533 RepID=UPI0015ABB163|nr:uncharacterized protein F54H12.2-like [Stegodyphus dumicola]